MTGVPEDEKDLIIRSGHNIDPKVIEDAPRLHPPSAAGNADARPGLRVGQMLCTWARDHQTTGTRIDISC